MDVLREIWQQPTHSTESVVSYLLDTYEKLESAHNIAGETVENHKTKYGTTDKLADAIYRVQTRQRGQGTQPFHVNMLARWESLSAVCLISITTKQLAEEDLSIPTWSNDKSKAPPTINGDLHKYQHIEQSQLLDQ